jgi:hypothetical protein
MACVDKLWGAVASVGVRFDHGSIEDFQGTYEEFNMVKS